jgi:hypothetical protein
VTLQLAPLAKAQSGNMSDATGQNGNFVGNMSDATGVLNQLLDGTLTEINGVIITAETRELMIALINGEQRGIGQLVSLLVQGGVSGNLAASFAQSLRGLFTNGQINQAQLIIVSQRYQQIVSSGVSISFLNSFGLFQSITALLGSVGVPVIVTGPDPFMVGSEINGITITAELQQLILALMSGNQNGIGELVSLLARNGVPGNLAAQFGQSLRGLFVNGQLSQTQLLLVGELYQQIISTRGQYVSGQLASGLFPSIASMLVAFGLDVTIPVVIVPVGPAGNISDATGLNISLEAEEAEETAEETAEEAEETAEEAPEDDVEIAAAEAEDDDVEIAAAEAEDDEVVTSEPVGEPLPTAPVAGLAATSEIQAPSDTSTAQETDTESQATATDTQAEENTQGSENAGAVTAGNAIVTTSDIAGGFQFATSSIFMAVIQAFQSLMAAFGTSQVAFGSISISVEVQVTVVSMMTGSSVTQASVPTYISSLHGGGTVASAPVDTYVNSLVNDGVPTNYAQALAATMEGMVAVDENGDVTNVDATKLTTAIAVYNETVNQLTAEALIQPSETLACTGYVLSSLTEAAANAANQ